MTTDVQQMDPAQLEERVVMVAREVAVEFGFKETEYSERERSLFGARPRFVRYPFWGSHLSLTVVRTQDGGVGIIFADESSTRKSPSSLVAEVQASILRRLEDAVPGTSWAWEYSPTIAP